MTPTAAALDDLMQAAKHTIQKMDRVTVAEAKHNAAHGTHAARLESERAMNHALTMLGGATQALRDAVYAIEHPEIPAQTTHTDPATGRTEAIAQ